MNCSYCAHCRPIVHTAYKLGFGIVRLCATCLDRLANHP